MFKGKFEPFFGNNEENINKKSSQIKTYARAMKITALIALLARIPKI